MSEQYDPFSPQRVDESVEQLTASGQANALQPSERLVRDMHRLYGLERKQYLRALQRVEDRLVALYIPSDEQFTRPLLKQERQRAPLRKKPQGSFTLMEARKSAKSSLKKASRRASLLVAVLILTVLVGSLLVVLNAAHQRPAALGHSPVVTPTVVPTPTPLRAAFGKTVYTTPATKTGFSALSWSPDSKRVASQGDKVQMWDATTGKHLVTIQFPANIYATALAWSPNSQLVAIGTAGGVELVNGETGALVRSYAVGATAGVTTKTGGGYLSVLLPTSGGLGVSSLAWSPDGKYLAVSLSLGATGLLQVVNAQTGALVYSLPITGNYVASTLAWSSDGQYVAANVFNTEPGSQTVPQDQMVMVWAWKVSTRQIVLKQPGGDGTADTLAWQPRSDTLAFSSWISRGNNMRTSVLAIWDVASRKVVHQYAAAMFGPVAWSPDGGYLAYAGASALVKNSFPVSVIDAQSGRLVYVYKQHHIQVGALAWSPDGKYIVSGEGNGIGNMVAKVWTAE